MTLDLLAIAAHPDDVEQTCGGTLIKMAEAGYRTGVLDLTAGDMGTRGTPEQRVIESDIAGKQMLVAWRGNMFFPDARLQNDLSARMSLAMKIGELSYESCFLAGLKKLDEYTEPHRPHKVIYSSLYANVTPSFVVDISAQFDRRMDALLSYQSQYSVVQDQLFPAEQEIVDPGRRCIATDSSAARPSGGRTGPRCPQRKRASRSHRGTNRSPCRDGVARYIRRAS